MKKIIFIFWGIIITIHGFSQNQESIQNLELKVIKSQFDSSIIIANQILKTDSANWLVHYYLGKSFQAKYKYSDAIKYLEKANQLDSANTIIENALAGSYDFIGKDEKAIHIYYDQYLRDTLNLDPIVNLANIFRAKREYAPAIHYYQKAVAIDPTNFFYYKQLAFCYDKINITIGAVLSYQTAIMLNPYDASLYIQLANILNTDRSFLDAIRVCEQGLEYYPENDQILKLQSYAYYLNRDFDSSIVGFNKLLEIGDTSFFNLKYRGLTFFEKKQFNNAIPDLLNAYEMNENDPELCFYLGSAFGRSNQNKEGIDYLNKSLKLLSPSPNELSNIYSEMANAYLNQKKYEQSLEYLKLAYKNNATPLLSFKMGQLYDYYLNNKKLAIDCYDGYLTMANKPDSAGVEQGIGDKSFFLDSAVIENAKERIRILTEEDFFEKGQKK